jgi:hypothetical protein
VIWRWFFHIQEGFAATFIVYKHRTDPVAWCLSLSRSPGDPVHHLCRYIRQNEPDFIVLDSSRKHEE